MEDIIDLIASLFIDGAGRYFLWAILIVAGILLFLQVDEVFAKGFGLIMAAGGVTGLIFSLVRNSKKKKK